MEIYEEKSLSRIHSKIFLTLISSEVRIAYFGGDSTNELQAPWHTYGSQC